MLQVPVDVLNNLDQANSASFALNSQMNSGNGRVPLYRGELSLSTSELDRLNAYLQSIECPFGKPRFIEVKEPPLISNFITPLSSSVVFSPLPARSTRTSIPNYAASSRQSTIGGKDGSGKSLRASVAPIKTDPMKEKRNESGLSSNEVAATPRIENRSEETPIIPANRPKIKEFVSRAYTEMANDADYRCLFEDAFPEGLASGPISLSTIRDRVEREMYLDHFQLQDDVIALASHWLHGPPMPNPMLPQYMAALKLMRKSTEWMIGHSSDVTNEDYYAGPDVKEAIKLQSKREQLAPRPSQTSSSPSFARKVRKTQSTGSAPGGGELKDIETQVALLTQQVMGLQKTKSTGPGQARASTSSTVRQDSMTLDEIRKLETDLMRLGSDDIDYVIGTMLKDEPSVKVDDESYELDVGALPASKQRALRRFVTRRLNLSDPDHEVQKLKQILKQDELARASEEMAERLLAGSVHMPAAILPAAIPAQPSISPEEEQRQRQREEEARRLWRIAHGDDDDDMDLDD